MLIRFSVAKSSDDVYLVGRCHPLEWVPAGASLLEDGEVALESRGDLVEELDEGVREVVGGRRPGVELVLGHLVDVEAARRGGDVEPLLLQGHHKNVHQVAVHPANTFETQFTTLQKLI